MPRWELLPRRSLKGALTVCPHSVKPVAAVASVTSTPICRGSTAAPAAVRPGIPGTPTVLKPWERALQQAPERPHGACPTGHDQYRVLLLPLIGLGCSVRATEAIPVVHHVHLEAVRLQAVPGAKGVVDQIVVIGEPNALRFGFDY